MIAKLFLWFTKFGWFRRLVWKPIYNLLPRVIKKDYWHFMNYGYEPDADEASPPVLPPDYEFNRQSVQLYHYLAIRVSIEGKHVLEVGSGRGGGSRHIATYLKPKSMTGMDLAINAVNLAKRIHVFPNLNFVQGNAEKLPFESEKFDVVINVESCHAYGSVDLFLAEVKRVLKPGGYLLLTDMRDPQGIIKLENQLNSCGMTQIEVKDISTNVVRAILNEEASKIERINRDTPKWLKGMMAEFGGAVGSQIHLQIESGDLVYKRYVYQKK